MRLNVAACAVALVVGSGIMASGAVIATSVDLDFIVGSGSNLSVLVVDFNDGPDSSFAWGYRWDGSATGEDLLVAITGADSNLTFDSTSFVNEITYFDGSESYSQTGDFVGAGVTWGSYLAGGRADFFDEVTFQLAGNASILGGGVTLPSAYTAATSGTSGRDLEDGSWDAWSFGDVQTSSPFAHLAPPGPEAPQAATVPEPSVTGLLASLLLLCGLRRKR